MLNFFVKILLSLDLTGFTGIFHLLSHSFFLDLTTFVPIIINAIPYNTFIHCIFNFIQALLSYRGFGTLPNKQFCRAKYGSGYSFPMLAMKVLSLVIYYNGKPHCQKRVKKNPVIPLYLFVFSIILTIMCLLFIMYM